ncbi:MAG: B12-binding domain-containing radical SAM protein [Candidatus Adiutrix sp.]|jgi:radical SAM superfamily enzyme YgiQ (UPF0313 family)|nr:B12-binding domain-containing radical SAM protein [Candidatus Adiutrix sp.]
MDKTYKVALCFPNVMWHEVDPNLQCHNVPYTLCLLAATIKDICSVDIIDATMDDLSPDDFTRRIRDGQYDCVGISVLFDIFAEHGHLAVALAKKARPTAVVAMGGIYPTIHPDRAMNNSEADYICLGEGDELLRALILHLSQGTPRPSAGLAYRNGQEIVFQEKAPFVQDLDALPYPAYDLVDFKKYSEHPPRKTIEAPCLVPYAYIITSRGCPQQCCFCQVKHIAGRKFRPRSPRHILDEIAMYKNKYGVRSLIFSDDNIVANKQRAKELFQGMVDEGLAMPWKAQNMAVFHLNEELVDLMAASGCKYISVSIESGSERVLKEIIKKPIDLEQAKQMIQYAKAAGIYVSANFVFGFPGETWDEIRRTLQCAEEIDADYVKLFSAIPLRHTALWDLCEREKAFKDGFDPASLSWHSGQIQSPHFDSRELTLLRAYEWDRINFSTPEKKKKTAAMLEISVEELDEKRKMTRDATLARLAMGDIESESKTASRPN